MQYTEKIVPAAFRRRPNRFIAVVEINGKETVVHVKNTGRCKELLVPGCTVYLAESGNPARKTAYDLIAVEKIRTGRTPLLINMDSQAPNAAAAEWIRNSGLFAPDAVVRREVVFGKSRFDFCIEDGDGLFFLEVKGCTLEQDGVASFPDAPTERGVKHLQELEARVAQGHRAGVLFVIQMKEVTSFRPNDETHPAFGAALRHAAAGGVRIFAYDCLITPDTMTVDQSVPVKL